jgi:hypothetical protein
MQLPVLRRTFHLMRSQGVGPETAKSLRGVEGGEEHCPGDAPPLL